MTVPGPEPSASVWQEVRAESGYAYGAMGADIHVFGTGTPVYLLFAYQTGTGRESGWLRAQPSRMLDARAEIVDFTGRDAEVTELTAWRDQASKLAVRWLHGPGGQGKTRLAARLAADSVAAGWKVVRAVHGTDTAPPTFGSQDLRLDGHRGVLVLVDYADRWPASHLSWLFHNRLLYGPVPARVLLIGRSVQGWPAIRGQLDRLRVDANTSDQHLAPLPAADDDRSRMFATAVACFAANYPEATDAISPDPPDHLAGEEFGLTLAVQMAALVTVDAAVHGRRAPADMTGLATYLLDREHENWRQLYENAAHGLPHRTPDHVMSRLVFTAVLTGTLPRTEGGELIGRLFPDARSDQLLTDHALCYPPGGPGGSQVLEPLLPDRLAEDFLALSLPGSPVTGYATDDWCATGITALLSRDLTDADAREQTSTAPRWVPRAVTFLAEAAGRWPHVGRRHLLPALDRDPDLALEAGSAALTSLSAVAGLNFDTVDRIEARFRSVTGDTRHYEVDVGFCALHERAARHRLVSTADLGEQAGIWNRLSIRQGHASLLYDALESASKSVDLSRAAVERMTGGKQDGDTLHDHAVSLLNQSRILARLGRTEEAVQPALTAGEILKPLVRAEKDRYMPGLTSALSLHATLLNALGRKEAAMERAEMAMECYRDLVVGRPVAQAARHLHNFTAAISEVAQLRADFGRLDDAVRLYRIAVDQARVMQDAVPESSLPLISQVLAGLARALTGLGQHAEALPYARESVVITRRLHDANPYEFGNGLVRGLKELGDILKELGHVDEAVSAWKESADLNWKLFPLGRQVDIAHVSSRLDDMVQLLAEAGRHQEALEPAEQAVLQYRLLTDADPEKFSEYLAVALQNLALCQSAVGRTADAVGHMEEAARRHLQLSQHTGSSVAGERLAATLGVLAEDYEKLGRVDDMLRAGNDSLTLLQGLARDAPEDHLLHRCAFQRTYAAQRIRAGRELPAAVEAARGAAETYEVLMTQDPDYALGLVDALDVLADAYDALGNRREAARCRRRRQVTDRALRRRS
ncbi:tetratricopeptide repeat protein [Streptomyces sp. Ru87]|uniref:tetratricopeptide repeat protein n=1 Tax=Streptomyces sp. Ru87 TaxID=2044307 RepID=UPI000BF2F511|nr:tetratricopeptide repeat protein [Streptomyces sp. Ru87]PGH47182.1 hypothetical protein CRI70_30000 [Streptomyces sp. Ru87]